MRWAFDANSKHVEPNEISSALSYFILNCVCGVEWSVEYISCRTHGRCSILAEQRLPMRMLGKKNREQYIHAHTMRVPAGGGVSSGSIAVECILSLSNG